MGLPRGMSKKDLTKIAKETPYKFSILGGDELAILNLIK